jgi:hypothetical protein
VRRKLFGLAPDEASFARRGFRGSGEPAQARLERIGAAFLEGYHAALDDAAPATLRGALAQVDLELRGFAHEGAAMALTLLDLLTPWNRSRLDAFLRSAPEHVYLILVGAGWAWARLRVRRVQRRMARLDPLLAWLTLDGYGFHEGFFHHPRYVERQAPPPFQGYQARVFDQGLGRSLWFVEGAGIERIIARIRSFAPSRQPDLWAGVGLACAYAGGCQRGGLEALRSAAGSLWLDLAQGVVFAVAARARAGNVAPQSELACDVICSRPLAEAARFADDALPAPGSPGPSASDVPSYERWRQGIQGLVSGRR